MRTLIKGGTILTMETGAQPFQGDLWIVDERIASVVRYPDEAGEGRGRTEEQGRENSQLPCSQPDRIIEAKGMAVMPGLVNSHQHTPMSLLRGFSNDLKLMDWLHQKMLPAEANMNREDIYWGAKLAMAEMIRSGTTAFADMYIEMDSIASAVVETGMRASLTRGLVFMQDDGGIRMREAVDLIDRWSGAADGRITTMIGPHSPYLCPPQPMQEVIAFARERGIPVHIHLAETREEVVRIRERYDRTPTEYLHQLGLFDSLHVLLAHAVHLTHKDIRLLGGMKGGVAHNPVSNLKLGCGIAPVSELLRQGVAVGLGTDGAGSAATLDMFEEIKAAAWLQKLDFGDPTLLPAGQALRMATIESAKLLRIDGDVGTLEAGKRADLILIDLKKPHLQPIHDVEALLAYSANGADVDSVMVDGVLLMQGRKLLTIDEEELYRQVANRAARIVKGV